MQDFRIHTTENLCTPETAGKKRITLVYHTTHAISSWPHLDPSFEKTLNLCVESESMERREAHRLGITEGRMDLWPNALKCNCVTGSLEQFWKWLHWIKLFGALFMFHPCGLFRMILHIYHPGWMILGNEGAGLKQSDLSCCCWSPKPLNFGFPSGWEVSSILSFSQRSCFSGGTASRRQCR